MPNWCQNRAIISGPKEKLEKLEKAFVEGKLLATIVPEPDYKKVVVKPTFPSVTKEAVVKPKDAWWDWRIQNWGTKWDIGGKDAPEPSYQGDVLILNFDSAWSPPVKAMEKLAEDNSDIRVVLYYWESGMGFAGKYDSEIGDAYYDQEKAPADVEQEFGIKTQLMELRGEAF